MNESASLPLEDFIQAITSQLDRTQTSMALKAKAGMPLTFAVKDLRIDLRAHLDMQGGAVTIRPAGPGDGDASTIHLELTTITRPMIEENTRDLAGADDVRSIRDVLGDELTEEDERRLEWVGIQDVAQYRELQRSGGNRLIQKVAQRPIDKLRFALDAASTPRIDNVQLLRPAADPAEGGRVGNIPNRLLLRGEHLRGSTGVPIVRVAGEAVPVVESGDDHVVVETLAHQLGGMIEIETAGGRASIAHVVANGETPFEADRADGAQGGTSS